MEDSNLKYVEGSERKKGMFLYKRLKGRMAGAYIVDSKFAQNTIKEIEQNKCNLPIDWLHNYCSNKELINIYWAQPSIAIQGSLNGKMESTIDSKPVGYNKILKFNINRFYKKLLYRLR